ncbi:MAG: ABC transporter substrate-binding protein [Acidimicrobiia bacterium]
MRRSGVVVTAVGIAAAVVLSACGGGSGGQARPKQELPDCPLSALDNVSAPVPITMWHAMAEDNDKALKKLADQFNTSQNKVKVTTVLLTTYDNVLEKVNASKTTGDLAEVSQIQDRQIQSVVDANVFLPAQSCINKANYSMTDFLPQVQSMFKIDGVQEAMPFNVSTPILYFDKTDFEKAGLDPNKPPATLDEVRSYAQKLKAANASTGAPFSFETDSWLFEEWMAKAGDYFVNGENGRSALATEASFNNGTGQSIFSWFESMRKDGLIKNYKRDTGYQNLFAIGQGESSMSLWSTAALGTALNILNAGILADKNIKLGAAPMPGPTGGGISAGGAGLYISRKASPEKIAASWQWLAFLNSASAQAQWAIETGFLPTTTKAAQEPNLIAYWDKQPAFKIGYDQMVKAPGNNVTAGPVIGPYSDVRRSVEDAITGILDDNKSAKPQLDAAAKGATTALQDYADRAGK